MLLFFYLLFFIFAFLYSMVGLGGGSAYVAILTISGTPYKIIPSTALFLNMTVSLVSFANYRFYFPAEKKYLVFLVYLLGGAGATVGASINLKEKTFFLTLGSALVLSALISFLKDFGLKNIGFKIPQKTLPFVSFPIGLLAGITGIGGGVYLSPLLIFTGFSTKEIASITSLYIFFNSALGFSVKVLKSDFDSQFALPLLIFALSGALLGGYLGSKKFRPQVVKFFLNLIILNIGGYTLWKGIS
jgi:uncharacterized membrane protein YfcA